MPEVVHSDNRATRGEMRATLICITAVAMLIGMAGVAQARSAINSSPSDTLVEDLEPGQWIWNAEAEGVAPTAIVIDLRRQLAFVYGEDVRIGVTTVSTGKKGKRTPTGVFPIMEKRKDHRSNIYANAPMPYMQRLTHSGIALHAGHLPGYPASHGCIRIPLAFAKKLFAVTRRGVPVVIRARVADEPEMALVPTVEIVPTARMGTYDVSGVDADIQDGDNPSS